MKTKTVFLCSVLLFLAACKQNQALSLEQVHDRLDVYMAQNAEAFVVDVAQGRPVEAGFAVAVSEPVAGLDAAIVQAIDAGNHLGGWTDGDEHLYAQTKTFDTYEQALDFAQKNNYPVVYAIAEGTAVPANAPDEIQDSAEAIANGDVSIKQFNVNGVQYYRVEMTVNDKFTRELGKSYAKCINRLPIWYLTRVGGYIDESIKVEGIKDANARLEYFKSKIDPQYREFIEGLATNLTTWPWVNRRWYLYMGHLLPDVIRPTSCSAMGVMAAASATGNTFVNRTLDWPDGVSDLFPKSRRAVISPLQTITKIKYKDKTVVTFGVLGLISTVTAIDVTNRTMVGILDADTEKPYTTVGATGSYVLDLTTAVKEKKTTDEVAAYLADPSRKYAFNHLILLADKDNVRVLENNMGASADGGGVRAVRSAASPLDPFVAPAWTLPGTIGAVNCFMLKGQPNNFNGLTNKELNALRWTQQIDKLKAAQVGGKLSLEDVRGVQSTHSGELKDETWFKNLYNSITLQMIQYVPATNQAHVWFRKANGTVGTAPQTEFMTFDLNTL